MTLIHVTVQQILLGSRADNVFSYHTADGVGVYYAPTIAALNEIRDKFVEEIIPDMNALQSGAVLNIGLRVEAMYRGVSISTALSGGGARSDAAADQPKKSLAFALRLAVDESRNVETGVALVDQSHRIQRGYKYIAGVLDGDMSNGTIDVDNFLEANDSPFRGGILETIVNPDVGREDFIPVVFGFSLGARGTIGTPGYKAPRPDAVATIQAAYWTAVSNLRKRQV